jgi:hypothetical protein
MGLPAHVAVVEALSTAHMSAVPATAFAAAHEAATAGAAPFARLSLGAAGPSGSGASAQYVAGSTLPPVPSFGAWAAMHEGLPALPPRAPVFARETLGEGSAWSGSAAGAMGPRGWYEQPYGGYGYAPPYGEFPRYAAQYGPTIGEADLSPFARPYGRTHDAHDARPDLPGPPPGVGLVQNPWLSQEQGTKEEARCHAAEACGHLCMHTDQQPTWPDHTMRWPGVLCCRCIAGGAHGRVHSGPAGMVPSPLTPGTSTGPGSPNRLQHQPNSEVDFFRSNSFDADVISGASPSQGSFADNGASPPPGGFAGGALPGLGYGIPGPDARVIPSISSSPAITAAGGGASGARASSGVHLVSSPRSRASYSGGSNIGAAAGAPGPRSMGLSRFASPYGSGGGLGPGRSQLRSSSLRSLATPPGGSFTPGAEPRRVARHSGDGVSDTAPPWMNPAWHPGMVQPGSSVPLPLVTAGGSGGGAGLSLRLSQAPVSGASEEDGLVDGRGSAQVGSGGTAITIIHLYSISIWASQGMRGHVRVCTLVHCTAFTMALPRPAAAARQALHVSWARLSTQAAHQRGWPAKRLRVRLCSWQSL